MNVSMLLSRKYYNAVKIRVNSFIKFLKTNCMKNDIILSNIISTEENIYKEQYGMSCEVGLLWPY